METPAPTVNDILNNALFHSSPRINQTLHKIFHVLHFCTLDSLLNYDPDFVLDSTEVRAVRPLQMISEIIALSELEQQMIHKLFG